MTDNTTLADELEECPFCGGEAELDRRQFFRHYRTGEPLDLVSIYCTSCSANISHYPGDLDCDRDATADLCIAAWNTRLSTQPQADAAVAVEQWLHVAYFDEGQFHWMSGIAPRDCELYARPIRAGGQQP